MDSIGAEFVNTSMKPYMDEYQSVTGNVAPHMNMLENEFATLISGRDIQIRSHVDIEKLAKKSHTEELAKLVQNLSKTRENLEQMGAILKEVEERVDVMEKKVGLDDDEVY